MQIIRPRKNTFLLALTTILVWLCLISVITRGNYVQADATCQGVNTNKIRLWPGGTLSYNGLLTLPSVSTDYYIFDPSYCLAQAQAQIPPVTVPSYDKLKAVYYQKSNKKDTLTNTTLTTGDITSKNGKVTTISNLTVSSINNVASNRTLVVFVDKDLTITGNIQIDQSNSGVVFIVGGNVNINKDVDRIDAVIVTSGKFCDTWDSACLPSDDPSSNTQLTINGSVIALDSSKPPIFHRSNGDNTNPGEIINYQPKYLVIFRGLLGRDEVYWTEIQ